MESIEQRVIRKMKSLKGELSANRLLGKLDFGDKHLLERILDDLTRRINQLEETTCSQLLESCGITYGN